MKKIACIAGFSLLVLTLLSTGGWSLLALFYAGPSDKLLSLLLFAGFSVALFSALLSLSLAHWHWYVVGAYFALFAVILLWFVSIEPSNTRDWQTDVALLPSAKVDGYIVTVHNIRNFDYRSETDFTPDYYNRQFDLRQLEGVDVVTVYWMGPEIAHVFLSFAFAGGEHLAISIETRKEKGEGYSTLKGFFRRYELFYVVADERDVIRLRTNYRQDPPEDVYVYRAAGSLEQGQRLFLEYIKQINALNTAPQFYNTLASNCTTTIWLNAHVNEQRIPLNWKVLVSGYLPEFLYESGRLDTGGLPFEELQQQVHINTRAQEADTSADFSRLIRLQKTLTEPANTAPLQEEH